MALLNLEKKSGTSRIPLCSQRYGWGTLLVAVGLGSISTKMAQPATYLQQAFFFETSLEYLFPNYLKICEKKTICTEGLTVRSNICVFDDGGPLYVVTCREEWPICLYGVASYFIQDPKRPGEYCTGGSVFTSVPDFLHWISGITRRYGTY